MKEIFNWEGIDEDQNHVEIATRAHMIKGLFVRTTLEISYLAQPQFRQQFSVVSWLKLDKLLIDIDLQYSKQNSSKHQHYESMMSSFELSCAPSPLLAGFVRVY